MYHKDKQNKKVHESVCVQRCGWSLVATNSNLYFKDSSTDLKNNKNLPPLIRDWLGTDLDLGNQVGAINYQVQPKPAVIWTSCRA